MEERGRNSLEKTCIKDRESECERKKDIVARKGWYATRRTYDQITRDAKKERGRYREPWREERARRTGKRSDVVRDECNEEHASHDAFVEEWSASGTERSHECGETEEEADDDEKRRGVVTSRKDAVVERAECRRGSMEGKKERCRKAEGGRAGRVKERERERKDRRGELPATRSPSIPR